MQNETRPETVPHSVSGRVFLLLQGLIAGCRVCCGGALRHQLDLDQAGLAGAFLILIPKFALQDKFGPG